MKVTVDKALIEQAIKAMTDHGPDWIESERAALSALRAALAEPAVGRCGYDKTTGNCTNNPCCFLPMNMPPAEVPMLSDEEKGD